MRKEEKTMNKKGLCLVIPGLMLVLGAVLVVRLGLSLYPPAPQFPGHPSSYTSPELFWLIKHGIRNTGMPAWGNHLADGDIWDLVDFLKSFPDLYQPVK